MWFCLHLFFVRITTKCSTLYCPVFWFLPVSTSFLKSNSLRLWPAMLHLCQSRTCQASCGFFMNELCSDASQLLAGCNLTCCTLRSWMAAVLLLICWKDCVFSHLTETHQKTPLVMSSVLHTGAFSIRFIRFTELSPKLSVFIFLGLFT